MKVMRKFIFLFLILIALLGVIFFSADTILEKISLKSLNHLNKKAAESGIIFSRMHFKDVRLHPIDTVTWRDFSAQGYRKKDDNASKQFFTFHIDEIILRLESFSENTLTLLMKGITVEPHSNEAPSPLMKVSHTPRLENGEFRMKFRLNYFSPSNAREQIRLILQNAISFFQQGRSNMPLFFSGISTFNIAKEAVSTRMTTERIGKEYILVLNRETLIVISRILEEELTDSEVDLFARNPFRAPQLLRIRNDAQLTAKLEHARNPLVPEDSFRHVLWSYLLTRAYGPKFAEKATDAHELGATDNTEAERHKDKVNNAVGREYALENRSREDILSLLKTDPKVIWD
jgi:hypothetical protein